MSDTRKLALELHEIRQLALGHATNPQFGNSSVDGEGLSFRDGDGNEIGRIGGGENGMEVEYTYGPKPLMPSTPIVTADANLLLVQWDGQWADGNEDGDAVADPDLAAQAGLDRVEVHASMDPTFVPDPILSFAGVLPVTDEGGAHTVGPLAEAGDYYVVLMARGKDGQYSAPSQRVHVVTTVGLMENELFDLALRADEARESADGKNTVHYGEEPEAPEGGFSEGDLWFDTVEDPETGVRKNTPHLWDPTANDGEGGWVSAADSRVDAVQDAVADLEDAIENIVIDPSTGMVSFYQPEEPKAEDDPAPKLGDLWFDTDDHMALYRHDGGGWVSAADERIQALQDAQDELRADLDDVVVDGSGTQNFYQTEPPKLTDDPAPAEGDLWFDQNDQNKPYIFRDAEWVSIRDDSFLSTAKNLTPWDSNTGNVHAISGQTFTIPSGELRVQAGVYPPLPDIEALGIVIGDGENSPVSSAITRLPFQGVLDSAGVLSRDATAIPYETRPLGVSGQIFFSKVGTGLANPSLRAYATFYDIEGNVLRSEMAQGQTRLLDPDVPGDAGFVVTGFTHVAELDSVIELRQSLRSDAVSFAMHWEVRTPRVAGSTAIIATAEARVQVPEGGIAADAITEAKLAAEAVTETKIAPDSVSSPKIVAGAVQTSHLMAEAVTAEKIATGTITADSGIIGSLNAGVITVGELDGARVKAGTVTADKLLIGGSENILPMSGVDAGVGVSPHSAYGGRTIELLSNHQEGREYSNALWLRGQDDGVLGEWDYAVAFNSGGLSGPVFGGDGFPVKVGQEFRADTYIMRRGSEPDGHVHARLAIVWYDFEGRWVATTTGESGAGPYTPDYQISVQGVAPERSAYMRLLVATDRRGDVVLWRTRLLEQKSSVFIGDGAITTEKIAVGAITAESGIIASLDAGKITVGELDGARVKAGTVTADKLLIGSLEELAPSPAVYGADWELGSGASFFGWADAYDGTGLQLPSGSRALGPYRSTSPGRSVHAEAWVGRYGGLTGDVNLNIRLYFYDRDRTYMTSLLAATGLGAVSGSAIAPDKAVYVRIGLLPTASFGDGWLSVRDMHGSPQMPATLIEGGAITTEKIATGAITAESGIIGSLDAGVITTGELRGELIRAQSIAGESLAVDAIDGKTITGATIRTSSAGARVEMDSTGLFVKNSLGTNTVSMTNGALTMLGGTITGGTIRTHTSGARVQLDTGGLKAWNPSNVETFSISANTGSVSMTGDLFQENDYGDIAIGPRLFNNSAPSLRFRKSGEAAEGYAGITMFDGGGRSVLLLYGAGSNTSSQGRAVLQLPHGQSTSPAGLYRYRSGSTIAHLRLDQDGQAVLAGNAGESYMRVGDGGGQGIYIRTLGDLTIYNGRWVAPNMNTGSGTDLIITSNNYIGKKSSSRRYKIAEEPIEYTHPGIGDDLLGMEVKTWFDRQAAERVADVKTANMMSVDTADDLKDVDPLRRIPGVVAEDLDEAGLGMFVVYNEDGSPESVMYDRLGVALVPVVRELRDRVNELERMMGEMANA